MIIVALLRVFDKIGVALPPNVVRILGCSSNFLHMVFIVGMPTYLGAMPEVDEMKH